MTYILVRQKVEDYDKWKPVYDADAARRKAGGSQGTRVFRSASDPNEVLVLLTWTDLESARRFAEAPELRDAMQRAGVVDKPDMYFLDEVDQTPA